MNKKMPNPKPVEKLTLSEKNIKLRFIIVIICLIIMVLAFGFAAKSCVSKDSGWEKISYLSDGDVVYDEAFCFYYDLPGSNATSTYKKVQKEYSELLSEAYKSLDCYQNDDESNYLTNLNANPNKDVKVSELLYNSLKKTYNTEHNYNYFLGPIASIYQIYLINPDDQISPMDEQEEIINNILAYVHDNNISLTFKDNNIVTLNVSDAYIQYMNEIESYTFIDFYTLRNAFIIDYVSKGLKDKGYTSGYLFSYDGYYSNLNDSNLVDYFPVIDKLSTTPTQVCKVGFNGQTNAVFLRSFKASSYESNRFYDVNNEIVSLYIDKTTGLPTHSISQITAYSSNLSTVDIALSLFDVFIKNYFSSSNINNELYYIYVNDKKLCYNDKDLLITDSILEV